MAYLKAKEIKLKHNLTNFVYKETLKFLEKLL